MIGHDAAIGILAVKMIKDGPGNGAILFFVHPVYCCCRMVLFAEDVVSLAYHRARWRVKDMSTGRGY